MRQGYGKEKHMRRKTFLKIMELQTEQSGRHLDEVRSIHKEMRGYKHDFHHHLQTLKGQLEAGEYDRALAYIDELDEQLTHMDTLMKTGNIALDAILSGKIARARELDIDITIKANIRDHLTISDMELSIIIGNLLDNAIEACLRSADRPPFMRIFISMKGKMLYFSMMNSSGEKRQKLGKLFGSGKSGLHGFGLRRACDIIERHGGWYKFNSEEGAFTSEFLVPAVS